MARVPRVGRPRVGIPLAFRDEQEPRILPTHSPVTSRYVHLFRSNIPFSNTVHPAQANNLCIQFYSAQRFPKLVT